MKQKFKISGMTCDGCRMSVMKYLSEIDGVFNVEVSLLNKTATFESKKHLSAPELMQVLPEKYAVFDILVDVGVFQKSSDADKSLLKQLKPLLLIFLFISGAAILIHITDLALKPVMLDFMGLFFVVFSFFKFLDLRGFVQSFKMYDPIAKKMTFYGWVYPFIELLLGVLLLFRVAVLPVFVLTIFILGVTTVGVVSSLRNKEQIQCACLGSVLKLPMTKATFIENSIMIVMAMYMLLV